MLRLVLAATLAAASQPLRAAGPSPEITKAFESAAESRLAKLDAELDRLDRVADDLTRTAAARIDAKAKAGDSSFSSEAARLSRVEKLVADLASVGATIHALPDVVSIPIKQFGEPKNAGDTSPPIRVGDVGTLYDSRVKVRQVTKDGGLFVDATMMFHTGAVRGRQLDSYKVEVLVRGTENKQVADGQIIEMTQTFEATGTHKTPGGRTVIVLEPHDPKRLAALQKKADDAWLPRIKQATSRVETVKADANKLLANTRAAVAADKRTAESDAAEKTATAKLALAKALIRDGQPSKAKPRLEQLIKDHPGTKAAGEAKMVLDGLH